MQKALRVVCNLMCLGRSPMTLMTHKLLQEVLSWTAHILGRKEGRIFIKKNLRRLEFSAQRKWNKDSDDTQLFLYLYLEEYRAWGHMVTCIETDPNRKSNFKRDQHCKPSQQSQCICQCVKRPTDLSDCYAVQGLEVENQNLRWCLSFPGWERKEMAPSGHLQTYLLAKLHTWFH